jgi:N-acetylglucosamine-6-phosphate deacetylase
MIVLSGASLVLPDRILSPGTLVIEDGRVAEIRSDAPSGSHAAFAFHGHYIVPGFIDVHIHGVDGVDTLDDVPGDGAIAAIAARLPAYGVTAFCPTTVACQPGALRGVLDQYAARAKRHCPDRRACCPRTSKATSSILNTPAHSHRAVCAVLGRRLGREGEQGREGREGQNGTNLTRPRVPISRPPKYSPRLSAPRPTSESSLALRARRRPRPRALAPPRGHRVSLGHSGATYEEALAAIEAGARQATHLFNRMRPLDHRAPGLVGAVLQAEETAAEMICDGFHVHPAVIRAAIAAKRPSRILAISDATAVAGLPVGSRGMLGGQAITAGPRTALLPDGTIAGSVMTMDRAFQTLIGQVGLGIVDAATICSTTPARELGLIGHGMLMPESVADLVVLDANFSVVQTYVAGQLVYARGADTQVRPYTP